MYKIVNSLFCITTFAIAVSNMPGEIIDRPNPPPAASNLPDSIEQLQVKLQKTTLDQPACDALIKFRKAAAYIAAGRERMAPV